ncbi:MAG: hypothetical protein JWR75_1581 [Devosia sp.]|nr:hypothetical protein [Devosia sp.]
MRATHTLRHHQDIQNWVSARKGMPAISRIPTRSGEVQAQLRLKFTGSRAGPNRMSSLDDGLSPVSWSAWFAELDRQNLALQVSDQTDFEFVPRQSLH